MIFKERNASALALLLTNDPELEENVNKINLQLILK
jgi:hypothetical protein